jgi:hypothetical protein
MMEIPIMMAMVSSLKIRLIHFMSNIKKDRRDGKIKETSFDFLYYILDYSF